MTGTSLSGALVGLQLAIWLPPDQTFTRAARASLPFLGLVAAPVTISLVMPVPLALGGALYGIIAAVVQRRFAVSPTPEPPTAHPR